MNWVIVVPNYIIILMSFGIYFGCINARLDCQINILPTRLFLLIDYINFDNFVTHLVLMSGFWFYLEITKMKLNILLNFKTELIYK